MDNTVQNKAQRAALVVGDDFQYLIQPNHITFAKREYNLYQEKIYTEMIRQLQEAIELSFNHKSYKQLEIFNRDNESVVIDIPLKTIANPKQYDDVRLSLTKMATQPIMIEYIDPNTNELRQRVGGLFTADFPKTPSYRGKAKIIIDKMVANAILTFDLNPNGQSIKYTRFLYDVVMGAKSPYHINIYRLLSSWKKKGFFTITYSELLDYLNIPQTEYKKFYEFKRRILKPAQDYLKNCGADCWFDCESDKFITYDKTHRKKVHALNFRVISKEIQKLDMNKVKVAKDLLSQHFNFKDADFEEIQEIFTAYNFVYERFTMKISDVFERVNSGEVNNKTEYIKTALKNEFLN